MSELTELDNLRLQVAGLRAEVATLREQRDGYRDQYRAVMDASEVTITDTYRDLEPSDG